MSMKHENATEVQNVRKVSYKPNYLFKFIGQIFTQRLPMYLLSKIQESLKQLIFSYKLQYVLKQTLMTCISVA